MRLRSYVLIAVAVGSMGVAACSDAKSDTTATSDTSPTTSAGASATTSGSASTNVTGTWSGPWQRTSPPPGEGTNTFTLTVNGDSVSGTVDVEGSACLTTSPISGTVEGDAITLHVSSNGNTADYVGIISGDSMSGTAVVTCAGIGAGTTNWTATRN